MCLKSKFQKSTQKLEISTGTMTFCKLSSLQKVLMGRICQVNVVSKSLYSIKINKSPKSTKILMSFKTISESLQQKQSSKTWKKLNKINLMKLKKVLMLSSVKSKATRKPESKKWSTWLMIYKISKLSAHHNKNIKTKVKSGWKVPKLPTVCKITTPTQMLFNNKWSVNKNPKSLNTELIFLILFRYKIIFYLMRCFFQKLIIRIQIYKR